MKLGLQVLARDFSFPTPETPAWAGSVDRWYQLDAFGYGLTDTYWSFRDEEALKKAPGMVFLASPGASNWSDLAFVNSEASSAHRFAHTLPNVRCSPLFQVMGWRGPALCIQKDPEALFTALNEAIPFVTSLEQPVCQSFT